MVISSLTAAAMLVFANSQLLDLLPSELNGWTAKSSDKSYTADTLYKYIDGGAEVYRSFNVRQVISRQYAKHGAPDITVDVFDMGSAEDAYGVYHHDFREGSVVSLGEESEYLEGSLAFWQAQYFVSIFTKEEKSDSKELVLKLGQILSDSMPRGGQKPAIVGMLPAADLQARHIYYFHDHFCLNAHYFVAQDNVLDLGKDTEGVLARYKQGDAPDRDFYLLAILHYPSKERALEAKKKFKAAYLPEAAQADFIKIENGKWAGIRVSGQYAVVVFDAPTREIAQKAAAEAAARTGGAES